MDSILLLSPENEKLERFLKKLGYNVLLPQKEKPIKDLISQELLDLVILDTAFDPDVVELVQYLRGMESTKHVPIVLVPTDKAKQYAIRDLELDRIEVVPAPFSVGALVTKVATNLRIRKMVGENSASASLAEANAALRDLNDRFKRELEQARSIQRNLLPEALPKSDRFEIAVTYRPLDEVGGDWYFVNKIANGKISIQIADVTGHGLSAAFIGSMTRLALCAAFREKPQDHLKETNRLMAPQLPPGTFVTMANYSYDQNSGEIELSSAGHPPAIIVHRASAKAEKLSGKGFAVGFFEDSDYDLISEKLEVGDIIASHTDGISEAQNRSGVQYGVDRLAEALLRTDATSSPQQIIDTVIEDFTKFCEGRKLKDDVTLIILKRIK